MVGTTRSRVNLFMALSIAERLEQVRPAGLADVTVIVHDLRDVETRGQEVGAVTRGGGADRIVRTRCRRRSGAQGPVPRRYSMASNGPGHDVLGEQERPLLVGTDTLWSDEAAKRPLCP